MTDTNLTLRQQKWFAAVRQGLERDTGRSLADWVEIARDCPETAQRARAKWLKDTHGLMQNRAMMVLDAAFGSSSAGSDPQALIDAVWQDRSARAILDTVAGVVAAWPETLQTARKSFTAWSRTVQFAALRPVKGGGAMLGLALAPDASARLSAPKHESWSERLKARLMLAAPSDVDAEVQLLLRAAWERS